MENRPYALAAGLFTLLLGLSVLLGAVWLTRSKHRDDVRYDLVTTGSIVGLNQDAAVRFRGVDIGRVAWIRFDPDRPGTIRIRLKVSPSAPITNSTYAQLGYQGITGIAYIHLDDAKTPARPLQISDDGVPELPMRESDLESAKDAGQELLKRMNRVTDALNQMLAASNQRQIMALVQSAQATSDQVRALAAELEPAARALPALAAATDRTLADGDRAMTSVDRAASDLRQEMGALDDTLGATRNVMRDVDAHTLPALNRLVAHGDQAIEAGQRSVVLLNRNLEQLQEQPQRLLTGTARVAPGPGEPGFNARKGQ